MQYSESAIRTAQHSARLNHVHICITKHSNKDISFTPIELQQETRTARLLTSIRIVYISHTTKFETQR